MLLYRIPHSVRPNFFYISLYINKIYRQLFYFKVTHLSRSLSFPLSAFLAILILFPPRWISQVLWYSFFFLVYILSILFPLISRFCDFSVDFSRCFVLMRFSVDFAILRCLNATLYLFCVFAFCKCDFLSISSFCFVLKRFSIDFAILFCVDAIFCFSILMPFFVDFAIFLCVNALFCRYHEFALFIYNLLSISRFCCV